MENVTITVVVGVVGGTLGAILNSVAVYKLMKPLMSELALPLKDAILAHRQDAAATAGQLSDHQMRLRDLENRQENLEEKIDQGFSELREMLGEIRVYIYSKESK